MGEDLEDVVEKEQDFWNKHLANQLREAVKEVRSKPLKKLSQIGRAEQEFITDVKRVLVNFKSLGETYIWLYNDTIGKYLIEHKCEPFDFYEVDED